MPQSKPRTFNFRDMENIFRTRRLPYPKRSVEFIALIAVSCTFFLFMHTQNLNSRLHDMEIKMQPSELSALGLTGSNSIIHDDSKHHDLKGLHGTYQYLKSTGQLNTLNTNDLNNTKNAESEILIFNRVPKVGSQSLLALLKTLHNINQFQYGLGSRNQIEIIQLNPNEQLQLIQDIHMNVTGAAMFSKHVAFLNFTKFNYPKPIYVNLVRDPVERLISWFYYIRTPWYFIELKEHYPKYKLPSSKWLRKDYEQCVRTGDLDCLYEPESLREGGDHRRQTIFFCGHNYQLCKPFNSKIAMQKAKQTVEEEYAVVGSYEDLNITLTVLEHYIPRFFRSANEIYYKAKNRLDNVNRNRFKPIINEDIKNLVRKNLTHEIEFYQFCKQRLYKQYLALIFEKIL